MLPVQQSDDLLIFDDLTSFQHDKLLEELLAEASGSTSNRTNGVKKKRETISPDGEINQVNNGKGSKELKKMMHRDVERQRRQEMAALFASLRSLLPLEFIKGKRSTSDHMNEAVKYINHMQKKIEGMKNRRGKLKMDAYSSSSAEEVAIVNDSTSFVKVIRIGDEIEILISSGLFSETFPLSRVLIELLGRDLNVVSCVSSRVNNERSLHKIQIQANDPTLVDLLELQNNLANLITLA